MSQESPSSKKILGPFEKLMLIGALALLVYLAFHRGGFKVAERTEEVTITDNPHDNEWQQKKRSYQSAAAEETDTSVDAVLAELADQYARGQEGSTLSRNAGPGGQLSKEEAEYIEDIKDKYTLDETVRNAKDWFAVLKASHSTYSKVKSLFEGLDTSATEKEEVGAILEDAEQSRQLYYKLQDWFNIPKEDIDAFAKSGK
ncbi:MAG: hypothetical protein AAFO94_22060, partial [Bacteroidota bacterium]